MHNASAPSVYAQVMKRMDDSKSIPEHSERTRVQFSMHNSFRVGWGAGRMFAVPARVDRDMKTSVAIRSVHNKEQNGTDRQCTITRTLLEAHANTTSQNLATKAATNPVAQQLHRQLGEIYRSRAPMCEERKRELEKNLFLYSALQLLQPQINVEHWLSTAIQREHKMRVLKTKTARACKGELELFQRLTAGKNTLDDINFFVKEANTAEESTARSRLILLICSARHIESWRYPKDLFAISNDKARRKLVQRNRPLLLVNGWLTTPERLSSDEGSIGDVRLYRRDARRLALGQEFSALLSDWKRLLFVHLRYPFREKSTTTKPSLSQALTNMQLRDPILWTKAGQSADMLWLMLWRIARKLSAAEKDSPEGVTNPSVTAQDPSEKLKYLAMLDPLGAPCDAHNYEISWHVHTSAERLAALEQPAETVVPGADGLHVRFAAQLEAMGLPEWAVYVAFQISDEIVQKQLICGLVDRMGALRKTNPKTSTDSAYVEFADELEKLLTRKLRSVYPYLTTTQSGIIDRAVAHSVATRVQVLSCSTASHTQLDRMVQAEDWVALDRCASRRKIKDVVCHPRHMETYAAKLRGNDLSQLPLCMRIIRVEQQLQQQPSIEELDQIESEMDAICENSLAQFGDALDGWPHGCEDAKESTWMNTMAEKVENVLWELARRQPARREELYTRYGKFLELINKSHRLRGSDLRHDRLHRLLHSVMGS